jgi:hypothetical protein
MLFDKLLQSLVQGRPLGRGPKREGRSAKRRLAMEPLEHRRLLARLEYTPDNGEETSLSIEVNEQGAFGYSDDLSVSNPDNPSNNDVNSGIYNPNGSIEDSGYAFASGIAIGFGEYNGDNLAPELVPGSVEQRHFLTAGYIGGRGTDNGSGNNLSGRFIEQETTEPDRLVSEFLYPNTAQNEAQAILKIGLAQELIPMELNGAPNGVVLAQTYTIQNISNEELNFDVIRYMDADLFGFPPELPATWATEPPINGGGLRRDGNLQNVASVFTSLGAADSAPFNDPTIVTIRGNPDDPVGIPPGEVNRWELGRGSADYTPDHFCQVFSSGYTVLRDIPDNCLFGFPITPAPFWKVLHHDWWTTYWTSRAVTSYNPAVVDAAPVTGRDVPDPLPEPGTLLYRITTGQELQDAVTNDQVNNPDFPNLPIPRRPGSAATNPPDDNLANDLVDIGDEYDVAMALRNVYTRVGPSQQVEYYTQTVFGHPPQGAQQFGSVAGVVYSDDNGDGDQQVGEPGLGDWTVFVDTDGDGVRSAGEPATVTTATGTYTIRNVPAGPQDLGIELKPDFVQTEPGPPAPPAPQTLLSVIVPPGSTSVNNDFGAWFQGGFVTGTKFMDLNRDGTQQTADGEVGLPGWTIFADTSPFNGILDPGEVSTVTASDGSYRLPLVLVGGASTNYSIDEINQPKWTQSTGPFAFTVTTPGQMFTADFGNDPDPFTITGIKWEDELRNGVRDSGEVGLGGVSIFIDVDPTDGGFNNLKDIRAVTAANGTYSLRSDAGPGPEVGPGTYRVREVVESTFDQTFPSSTCCHTVNAEAGDVISGINFGNRFKRASVSGRVTNAATGAGMKDVFIYIDMNNDGKRGLTEPGAFTLSNGTYRINDIRPNTSIQYVIRQDASATQHQVFPAGGNGHVVTLAPATHTPNLNFRNLEPEDYGDAPASYSTSNANAARHPVLAGYRLGDAIDGELNGQPGQLADGDDLDGSPNDEDGVVFVSAVTPGASASVEVTLTQDGEMLGRPPQGYLQGWVDFNQNGVFDSGAEQIFTNKTLSLGTQTLQFTVPAGAVSGRTYARFRLALSKDVGPTGLADSGEVEDYVVNVISGPSPADLVSRDANGNWQVSVNNGTAFVDQPWGSWPDPTAWTDVVHADFNGDGLDDVAGRNRAGEWRVSINTGSGFLPDQKWGHWVRRADITWEHVQVADVNGDTFPDIVGRAAGASGSGSWYVAENQFGSSVPRFRTARWGTWSMGVTWDNVVVGNFTLGDNRDDLMGRTAAGNWWLAESLASDRFRSSYVGSWASTTAAGWNDVMAANLTGDARADLVGRSKTGKWWVSEMTNAGLVTSHWGTWAAETVTAWKDVALADITGDSGLDVVGRADSSGRWYVGRNVGAAAFNTIPYGDWSTAADWRHVLFADYDGDGETDVAGLNFNSGKWWLGINNRAAGRFSSAVWGEWEDLGWRDVDAGAYAL